MAKTKAKKIREKMIRDGKRNPNADRSVFAHSEMYKMMATKKTKTKKDQLNRIKHKERISAAEYSDDSNRSFLMVYKTVISPKKKKTFPIKRNV